MTDKAKTTIKVVATVIIAALTALLTALGLNSCALIREVNKETQWEYKTSKQIQKEKNTDISITNDK